MAGFFGFLRRGKADIRNIRIDVPESWPDENAMRLLQVQDHIHQADRIIRAFLTEQSGLMRDDRNVEAEDVLLEVLSALGSAPACADVPVTPGRST